MPDEQLASLEKDPPEPPLADLVYNVNAKRCLLHLQARPALLRSWRAAANPQQILDIDELSGRLLRVQ